MITKYKKGSAMKYIENLTGGPLSLGELLEAIRLADDISQVDFAKKLNISKSHLCDIEKGRKTVSLERASKLARMLGYSEEQFVRLALQEQIQKAGLDYIISLKAA
jgi:antitoxin HigA-1